MTRIKLLIAAAMLMLSGSAFACFSTPDVPQPVAPTPPPQSSKAPEIETYKRKNRRSAGAGSVAGTMLTTTDATQAEAGINLGKNTLLGS